MMSMSPRMSKIAAVGLLLGVVGFLLIGLVLPYASAIATMAEEIETERAAAGRFAAIANLKSGSADIERAGALASQSEAYLKGDTEALKTSALQGMLSELAQGMGVRLRSTRNLPVREKEELRFIGVRMQFNAEIDQVRALLHGIESAKPFLLIDGMQVQPLTYYSPQEHGGSLEVRLDVYGAMPRRKG